MRRDENIVSGTCARQQLLDGDLCDTELSCRVRLGVDQRNRAIFHLAADVDPRACVLSKALNQGKYFHERLTPIQLVNARLVHGAHHRYRLTAELNDLHRYFWI